MHTPTSAPAAATPRTVQRVRHPLQARLLEVLRVQRLSPHFVSITLGGPALAGFVTASFDDHVKLMLPAPGQQAPTVPGFGPDGPQWPEGAERPVMRDYTPRRHDPVAGELDIEFALHGEGPAAAWAAQATPGQQVGIGGPRGSFVVPTDHDWHLLIGDETALPAITRRLGELPAGVTAAVLVQLSDAGDQRALRSRADLTVQWVPAGTAALLQAVEALALPAGEGYAWAAGEAQAMAAVRRVLVGTHGLDKDHVRAATYWKQGAAGHHENLGT